VPKSHGSGTMLGKDSVAGNVPDTYSWQCSGSVKLAMFRIRIAGNVPDP
jgi:hypothetical protein